jgi:hypothetical protein
MPGTFRSSHVEARGNREEARVRGEMEANSSLAVVRSNQVEARNSQVEARINQMKVMSNQVVARDRQV